MVDQRSLKATQPCIVYATNLAPLLAGHALWFPEPHRTGAVHLCDVGYIKEGAFVRLLNTSPCPSRPQVDHWSSHASLSSLVPLDDAAVMKDTESKAYAPGHYASDGVTVIDGQVDISASAPGASVGAGVNLGYTCNAEQGALLVLKNWGLKEDLYDRQDIRDYILAQHDSWVSYARNELHLRIAPEDLVFVRGYVKTSPDWLVAAFSNSSTVISASMNATAGAVAGGALSMSKKQAIKNRPVNRFGVTYYSPSPMAEQPSDQCVVIQRYVVRKRMFRLFGRKLKAAAGPHQLPDQSDEEDGAVIVTADGFDDDDDDDEGTQQESSPLNTLLDYILEASDADAAIACEGDIANLFLGQSWPADLAEYLRSSQPPLEVFQTPQGEAGMLSMPENVARHREHVIATGIAQSFHDNHSFGNEAPVASIAEGKAILGSSRIRSTPLRWPHAAFKNKNEENGVVTSVALSPNGNLLAVAWDDITISIWRVKDGTHVQQLEENGHSDTVWTIIFSPDGYYLASGSSDTNVIIWDIAAGQVLTTLQGHSSDVAAIAYSPDGSLLATGSTDGCIKLWNVLTGSLQSTLQEQDAEIRQLAFSSTGSRLASCTISGLLLWDPVTGVRVASLDGHNGALWSVAFSPEGDRLITGSEDHTARIWDAMNGDELVTLQEHRNSVWAVAFSPDGREVATASYDGTVVTCDSFTGERHHVFSVAHSSPIVEAVAYSKEHDFIAAGSADGSVRVWNSKSGAPIAEFQGHEEKVRGVAFTPSGWDVISHAEDGTVRVWSVLDALRL